MTATAAPINTPRYGAGGIPNQLQAPQKALGKILVGTIVCLEAGYATEGRTALGLIALGIAYGAGLEAGIYDNSAGANGDKTVVVDQGVFPLKNSAAGDAITQADAGKICYIVDNQTVAKTSGNNTRSPAGRVAWVDGDGIPWVQIGLSRHAGNEAAALAAAPAWTVNDLALASVAHGSVIDIPVTTGASTVTLPGSAPVGTILHFTADGTKNAHTVQYRDGGRANLVLTAALTAAKTHGVTAIKGLGGWSAIPGVSP